ncbi:MAG: UbiX family flavin prenyltransferase [Psychromonas sp.]|nr:UbiX family flavin prenyltransferase [Psychromonas sp.]
MSYKKRVTLAVTGASGSGYFLHLLKTLLVSDCQVYLLLSDAAKIVLATECDEIWPDDLDALNIYLQNRFTVNSEQLTVLGNKDWFSVVASGSSCPSKMVICPCSGGTLASIAMGLSNNLIQRAADVVIKEKGQLIVMPRETPFSVIHLQNMLTLSKLGVVVMPLAPGFYYKPQTIDEIQLFMVAKVLDHLKIKHSALPRWCDAIQ